MCGGGRWFSTLTPISPTGFSICTRTGRSITHQYIYIYILNLGKLPEKVLIYPRKNYSLMFFFSNFCLILELRNVQGCHRPEAVRNLQPPQSMPWGVSTLLLSSVLMICVIACMDIYLLGLFSLGGGGGGGGNLSLLRK